MQTVQRCNDWGQVKLSEVMQTVEWCNDWGQVKLSELMQTVEWCNDWGQVKLSKVMQTVEWCNDWGQVKISEVMQTVEYDLLNRHLTTNSSCDCGERKETSEHYILHCPRFTHVRQNTIFRLPANLLNITTLLQGDPNISNKMNSLLFKAVQDFITQSGRFAIEWQTQLNSYWQRMRVFSLSLSLDFWLICGVVYMLFNIIIHTRYCKMN